MAGTRAITGYSFGKVLHDAGILPTNCRRMILDVRYGGEAVVYYECYADTVEPRAGERFLTIDWDILKGAKQIHVVDMEASSDAENTND